jgi:hypothetical protein
MPIKRVDHEANVKKITTELNNILQSLGLEGGLVPYETDRNIYTQTTELAYEVPDPIRGGKWVMVLEVDDTTLEDKTSLEAQLHREVSKYKKYFPPKEGSP